MEQFSKYQFEEEAVLLANYTDGKGLFVDVGSNIGDFSQFALDAGHKVISIEPSSHCIQIQKSRFAKAIQQNRLLLHKCACSDAEGELTLYLSDDENGLMSSLEPAWRDRFFKGNFNLNKTEQTKTTRLAVLLSKYLEFLNPFSVLKIDVEGHDLVVLIGFFIKSSPLPSPSFVMFEYLTEPERILPLRLCLSILRANGYDHFKFFIRHGNYLLHETDWLDENDAIDFDVAMCNTAQGNIPAGRRFGNVIASHSSRTDFQKMPQRPEKVGSHNKIERFLTRCPHCKETLNVTHKGHWNCPCCNNEFIY